jgi:hypothetical protein
MGSGDYIGQIGIRVGISFLTRSRKRILMFFFEWWKKTPTDVFGGSLLFMAV